MAAKDNVSRIEIRPEVTMLSVLRHLNYKPWFALAEFIDNAVQSFSANRQALLDLHGSSYQLKIAVRIDSVGPGQISITDNAAGISEGDFPRAFRPAQAPADRAGLSEFGMGMKSAACWFSRTWEVRTKALGEAVERTISFDVRDIVENKVEALHPVSREIAGTSTYTVVSLRGLHHPPQGRTIGKIKDHLASIYRMFLRDGSLELKINDEALTYSSPKILTSMPFSAAGMPVPDAVPVEWRKEIDLDFGSGQRVRGFAALREVGSTLYAGFALFRRGRLIEGSHDETYRPTHIFRQTNSYPYQRLFGELTIEGFDVSHTKDGFRWEAYEDIFLEYLKDAIEAPPLNLILQAENYRALPTKKSLGSGAAMATDLVAKHIEQHVAPLIVDARANPAIVAPLPIDLAVTGLRASERTVRIEDGGYVWVVTLRTSIDPAISDWVSIAKDDSVGEGEGHIRRLGIDLSLAHPFSMEFLGVNNENIELFLRVAAAIGISLVLSQDVSGDPPESVLYHFNYLLRGALARAGDANEYEC